jgi:hypothetical protein
MQLVSYGAQDVYISGNPQITFWKILYKRHTNFAVESIEVTFNGQADFNKRVTAIINRNADMMYKTYLQVVLPEVNPATTGTNQARWVHFVGHQLINMVEVEIGGQRIDRQYGDWMQIWTQLSTEAGSVRALNAMIGQTAALTFPTQTVGNLPPQPCTASGAPSSCGALSRLPATTLYIPLQFWFCRNPGVAIPLIALQYHEVRINVEFNPVQLCAWQGAIAGAASSVALSNFGSLAAASLYVDYCYLDTEERRRFAQQSHEYLIEQVQYTGAESITSSSNKIQLNFNHPVKELFWVVQRDSFVDCSLTSVANTTWLGVQPFNYSDDFDVSVFGLEAVQDTVNSEDLTAGQNGPNANLFLLGKVILESDIRCEGGNPVEVAKLQLNGQDRFTEREGSYFDKVQPYQHHCRTPSTGINCYSFALRPEEHQPSGTCNFSRIDKATLQLTVSVNTVSGNNTAQVRVYALNYNVLRVMSGMGGLAYSN